MQFEKKRANTKEEIPTASMPDIIFMLLLFFMVTTTMREVEVLVDYRLPDAEALEKIENKNARDEISSIEQKEGFVKRQILLTERNRLYLEFLGELSVGVSIGVFSMIFNFILFVWLLHIEF